jgi:histone H3/H4
MSRFGRMHFRPRPKGPVRRYRMPVSLADRKALVNIRFMQKCTKGALEHTFKNTSFKNLVRELGQEHKVHFRWSKLSFVALAEAAQGYMTKLFEDADLCRDHADRKKVSPADLQLARQLQLPRL